MIWVSIKTLTEDISPSVDRLTWLLLPHQWVQVVLSLVSLASVESHQNDSPQERLRPQPWERVVLVGTQGGRGVIQGDRSLAV